MGKTKNSGLGVGTSGSPQGSIAQGNIKAKVDELVKKNLINELVKTGAKYNAKDIIFITKDKTGQLIWLEAGDACKGLKHILYGNGTSKGHYEDFKKAFGLGAKQVGEYLRKVITYGNVVKSRIKKIGKRFGYEKIYNYKGNYYVVAGIGTNGFIVSAYPKKKEKK